MTPGWKTTEWWTTLIKLAMSAAVTVGILTTADAHTLGGQLGNAITAAFMFISNAWAVTSYIRGRAAVKGSVALAEAPKGVPYR